MLLHGYRARPARPLIRLQIGRSVMISPAGTAEGGFRDVARDADRIVIDVPDMTSCERVLELFDR